MATENGRRPAARGQPDREIPWVVVAIIVFAIVVAAAGAWADSIGDGSQPSTNPAATATVVPVEAPIAP